MGTTIQEIINSLPPEQRKEVEELGAKLIAEEYARREAQANSEITDSQQNPTTDKVESVK